MIQKVIKKIHFVGIGGIGMSGIAEIMLNQGFQISGSDLSNTEITESLKAKGVTIYEGHSADNVKDADVLVYSSAVKIDNPEVQTAIERKIPVIKRSEMLAECMRMRYGTIFFLYICQSDSKLDTLDQKCIENGRENSLYVKHA